jgi:Ca-activated chloride channel homolog
MFRFENIHYLYALLLIPVFIILYILARYSRKKAIRRFGDHWLVSQLMEGYSRVSPLMKFVMFLLAFLTLVIAIANPQLGSKPREVKREGADIMIALDVSNSMMAEDLYPTRLEKAKQAIERLIDGLKGDRLGIIVFAGEAFVQLPITTDYSAAKLFLDNINPDIVPTQGTNIDNAIYLAMESFGKDVGKNKALIIITDGEDHEGDPAAAAKEALEKGIVIHTIGIGSASGVPIPDYKFGKKTGFKRDKNGNTVITKLNEAVLQNISAAGNGIYVRATNAEMGFGPVLNEVEKLQKKEFQGKIFTDYEDQFQYFLAFSLILFILEALISERKSKGWEKLNLFGEKK